MSRTRRRPQDEAPPAENCMELEFETDDEARPPAHRGPSSLLVCACLAVPLSSLRLPSRSVSVSFSVVSVSLRLHLSLALLLAPSMRGNTSAQPSHLDAGFPSLMSTSRRPPLRAVLARASSVTKRLGQLIV